MATFSDFRPAAAISLLALALTGCGTTRHFVDHPRLRVAPPSASPRDAIAAIFSGTTPLYVSLCTARRSSKECLPGDSAITAQGVGGLVLPLRLEVRGIRVSAVHETAGGTTFDSAIDSKVDAIAPLCGSAHLQAVFADAGSLSLHMGNVYCNWALIGNVIVSADFSIDSISLSDRTFTGFYRIAFYGTGIARGSGYFRAAIAPAAPTTVRSASN